MDLKSTGVWTGLIALLVMTTVVPFALAPMGGQVIQDNVINGHDVANQIVNGALVGLYNGSITAFYSLVIIIWIVGFFLINPTFLQEMKEALHKVTK